MWETNAVGTGGVKKLAAPAPPGPIALQSTTSCVKDSKSEQFSANTSTTESRQRESTPELRSVQSVFSVSDDYWYRVLSLCHQRNPLHFGLEFPSQNYIDFEYLDSGTYSHVVKATDLELGNVSIVFKIIKVVQRALLQRLSDVSIKGFELYGDVFQEIVIMKMLSNLHDTVCDPLGHEYRTHAFPRLYRTRIVNGEIPNYFFIRKYSDDPHPHSEKQKSKNHQTIGDSTSATSNSSAEIKIKAVERFDDTFGVPREHLVVVMKFGGDSLWDRIQGESGSMTWSLSADQIISICYQLAMALAIAEACYQFEHRDLHACNVLVKRTDRSAIEFVHRSAMYRVKSFGIEARIIDTTFSRIEIGGNSYYTDLTNRLRAMAQIVSPESHELAYAQMYRMIGDRWREWFPRTNLVWLRQVFGELAECVAFKGTANGAQVEAITRLMQFATDCSSVAQMVQRLYDNSAPSADPPPAPSTSTTTVASITNTTSSTSSAPHFANIDSTSMSQLR